MRATGWVNLPAFGSGRYYSWADGGATSVMHIFQIPGADPAINGEYLTEQEYLIVESAHAHLSYINGSFPYGFRTDARDALAVGFSFEGENFDPYIAGDVYVSPTIVGNRSISVVPYTYSDPWNTGPGQVGPGSAYSAWWMGWGPVIKYMDYYRYEATAVVHLPSEADIATLLRYVVGDPPYGSDGIRYSYLQTDLTSPIPQFLEIYFTAARDGSNVPILDQTATLTPYVQWIPKDTTATPRIFGSVPGSPWVQAGDAQSLSYDGTGVAGPLVVDTSVLGSPDLTGYSDYGPFVILVAFYYTPNPPSYTDPTPDQPPDEGPYHPPAYDDWFAWSDLGYVYHYDAGQVRYRWIGPEVPSNGTPVTDPVFVGDWTETGGRVLKTVKATIPPSIPASGNYLFSNTLAGIARPQGRVGGDLDLLVQFGANFYVLKWHITREGVIGSSPYVTLSAASLQTAGGAYILSVMDNGYINDYLYGIGGNETSKMLVGGYAGTTDTFYANLIDTMSGSHVHCTGLSITPGGAGAFAHVPAYTSGNTFLLPDSVADYPFVLRYQRWSISASGAATRVGPLMAVETGNSYIYHDARGDVWDEDGIVGVMWGFYNYSDASTGVGLAVFDGTSTYPRFVVTIDTHGTMPSDYWRLPATFYKTPYGGYGVTYLRSTVNTFTPADTTGWGTWVRRSIDITTGALGPEILLADTTSPGTRGFLQRQDDGVGIIEVLTKANVHTPGQPYYYFSDVYEDRLRLVTPGGVNEGTAQLGSQSTYYSPMYNPDLWVGLWLGGVSTPGRLYFKYREP